MALCRYVTHLANERRQYAWGWMRDGAVTPLDPDAVAAVLSGRDGRGLPALATAAAMSGQAPVSLIGSRESAADRSRAVFAAPIADGQEVWAAGVTYESSKLARMAESEDGGDFYAKVYTAERPELFLKATPNRIAGPGEQIRIRADSSWNVPEPELAALIGANGTILGYTIGNDVSSRDIEGANPLYLPQAKVYPGSCALGPWVVPAESLRASDLSMTLKVRRGEETVFEGETSTARMRRTVEDLAAWLFRENEFPFGVYLLTGTGIVPPDDFTLESGDDVVIGVEGIGELRNAVAGRR